MNDQKPSNSSIPKPTLEQVLQWHHECYQGGGGGLVMSSRTLESIIKVAITWAAPIIAGQELDACEEWMKRQLNCTDQEHIIPYLRAYRRPKSLSLKQQATIELDDAVMRGDCITVSDVLPILRRVIEALPE
jgi:hypothetical protein